MDSQPMIGKGRMAVTLQTAHRINKLMAVCMGLSVVVGDSVFPVQIHNQYCDGCGPWSLIGGTLGDNHKLIVDTCIALGWEVNVISVPPGFISEGMDSEGFVQVEIEKYGIRNGKLRRDLHGGTVMGFGPLDTNIALCRAFIDAVGVKKDGVAIRVEDYIVADGVDLKEIKQLEKRMKLMKAMKKVEVKEVDDAR